VGHVKAWREDNFQEGRSLLVPNESRQAALWEVINDLHKYIGDLSLTDSVNWQLPNRAQSTGLY